MREKSIDRGSWKDAKRMVVMVVVVVVVVVVEGWEVLHDYVTVHIIATLKSFAFEILLGIARQEALVIPRIPPIPTHY